MTTAIIRHQRENIKKCSLRGLEGKEGLCFYTYPVDPLPGFFGFLLLKVGGNAPLLTDADRGRNLLLIDATWRLAQTIQKQCVPLLETRTLSPYYRTAYPRRQTHCPEPLLGLSSVEALYLAHRIVGREHAELLTNYYWKESFLALNGLLIPPFSTNGTQKEEAHQKEPKSIQVRDRYPPKEGEKF